MLRTRLNSTASCLKSGDSVNSGSTSSLRRACSGRSVARIARRHRAHVAHVEAALLEHVAHAVEEEVEERSFRSASAARPCRGCATSCRATRLVDAGQLRQIDQNAHEALRRAAQPVRIARAGRPLAGGKHPDDGVELVGQRHGRPRRGGGAELLLRRRRVGFDADRQVVVVDRLPHRLGLAVLARVDAAHRALQLGHLADHVGREIGLAQPAGGLARALPSARRRRARRSQSSVPASRRARPSRRSCPASCERGPSRGARRGASSLLLAIGIQEEARVAQPRRQHALEIARDQLGLVRPPC